MRRPTIYDVATEAGVAPSTVSRAFAKPGRVNADTARRIFEAAERVGYRNSRIDGALGRKTRAVALVVSSVSNPFYAEIIRGAQEAAHEAGYVVLLSHTEESAEAELDALRVGINLVEGIVFASSRANDAVLRGIAKQRPVVLLNRRMPELSSVIIDNPLGVRLAVAHLVELGHRSVCYLSGPEISWTDGVRWRALLDEAEAAGLKVSRTPFNPQPAIGVGARAAQQVAETGATAVLAYNDQLAVGLIKGLKRLGLSVPGDVSVIGFDNTVLAEVVEPALTSVASPQRLQGATGVRNVLALARDANRLRRAEDRHEALVMPVKLVIRESTAPPRG